MNRTIGFVGLVVVVVAGLLFVGKSASKRGAMASTGGHLSVGNYKGSVAPDFELKVLGQPDKSMKLSELRGKGVLVNFWATWCEPCKLEMPWFVELQKQYGPQGLQIVGVAMDDTDEKTIGEFAKKMGVNYPIMMGTEKVADQYGGVDGLPTSFFVDRSGKVVDRAMGLVSESVIVDNIKKALGGEGTASLDKDKDKNKAKDKSNMASL